MKEKRKIRVVWFIGSVVLTAIGFIVIPSIIDKYEIRCTSIH